MEIKSKYFTYEELTYNSRGITNIPNEEQLNNLQELVTNVLDPLRELYGKPIKINSGFRCTLVNEAVGGVNTSEHLKGYAADITTQHDNKQLYDLIRTHFKFRQLINESNFSWVHVSYNKKDLKMQLLKL